MVGIVREYVSGIQPLSHKNWAVLDCGSGAGPIENRARSAHPILNSYTLWLLASILRKISANCAFIS